MYVGLKEEIIPFLDLICFGFIGVEMLNFFVSFSVIPEQLEKEKVRRMSEESS